jgi:hypothetical protein
VTAADLAAAGFAITNDGVLHAAAGSAVTLLRHRNRAPERRGRELRRARPRDQNEQFDHERTARDRCDRGLRCQIKEIHAYPSGMDMSTGQTSSAI